MYIFGEFNNWDRKSHALQKKEFGIWTLELDKGVIPHSTKIKLHIEGADGIFRDKISAWIKYAV